MKRVYFSMSNLQTNCHLRLFPKTGPTYRRRVVNPRHQTSQGQSVAKPGTQITVRQWYISILEDVMHWKRLPHYWPFVLNEVELPVIWDTMKLMRRYCNYSGSLKPETCISRSRLNIELTCPLSSASPFRRFPNKLVLVLFLIYVVKSNKIIYIWDLTFSIECSTAVLHKQTPLKIDREHVILFMRWSLKLVYCRVCGGGASSLTRLQSTCCRLFWFCNVHVHR